MTKIAYLECPTGIAGDMCLGAIVDAGVPLPYLIEKLNQLGIANEYQLRAESVHRNGQQATKVHVDLAIEQTKSASALASSEAVDRLSHHRSHFPTETATSPDPEGVPPHTHSHNHHHHLNSGHHHGDDSIDSNHHSHAAGTRRLPEIEQLILAAGLPAQAEVWSLQIFRQLAKAEAAVHGIPPEQVHFHEVGATDAIVDIVGTCLGLDWLGIDQLYCSPLPTGGGTVRAAHGRLPVPAPAVLKLWELRQTSIYSNGIERELVTPTGAAIVTTLAAQFGSPPAMTLQKVGLGAGSIDLPIPNILRLWIGEAEERKRQKAEGKRLEHSQSPTSNPPTSSEETIAVLETQIDDLTPQAIGYVFEALFAAGALDVFTQAIGMKKSRSGVLLTVICSPETVLDCEAIIFQETTTLGIRKSVQQRKILQREIQQVQTSYGSIRVKVAWADDPEQPMNVQPEYEDCAQIARQHQIPWREVHRLALQAWYSDRSTKTLLTEY